MSKQKRLGQGLAALLGAPLEEGMEPPLRTETFTVLPSSAEREGVEQAAETRENDMFLLDVDAIDANPFQPRRDFNEPEIASLAESLKEHDMLQPVLVRQVGDRYQLISGERRLRAAIQAGWTQLPARLRQADDRLVAELAIVENLQRKDLNAIEKALSFKRYLEEHQCTQEDLAQRLKIDRSTIANKVRLLELPDEVKECLRTGAVSEGHAKAMLPLGDDAEQIRFCHRIRAEGLSVRATERLVQEWIREADGEPSGAGASDSAAKRTKSGQLASLEQELRMALGTKVEIRQTSRGRGRIIVHFAGHEEFERLRDIMTDSLQPDLERKAG